MHKHATVFVQHPCHMAVSIKNVTEGARTLSRSGTVHHPRPRAMRLQYFGRSRSRQHPVTSLRSFGVKAQAHQHLTQEVCLQRSSAITCNACNGHACRVPCLSCQS